MKRCSLHALLALALVGLWVLLPVAGVLHDEDHAHRYCAEHGVLEEAGPGAVAAAQDSDDGFSDADAAAGGLHVSCGFGFVHRAQDGLESDPARQAAVRVAAPVSNGLVARDGAPVLPVLAQAPKSSPPAC